MANRWFLLAGAIAFLIFLPNLIWEVTHHFPHMEQLENIRRNHRNVELTVVGFLAQHVLGMQPLALPVWVGGLAYAVVILLTGILIAPILLPILPPETYIRYSKATGLAQPRIEHRRPASPLPQLFADRCGWPEMAEA